MNAQPQPKAMFGCLTAMAALVLLVSFLFVRSLNPLAVYSSGSITAKVIVSILLAMIGGMFLQFLGTVAVRAAIANVAGRPAEDVLCPGCGNLLIAFMGAYGAPVLCPGCGVWWHSGPACFRRGLPPGRHIVPSCPDCRKEAESERDLYDNLGSM